MPENKAFLLLALSDFSSLLWSVAFLASLHLVPVITTRPLITTSPPPSVLHAGMLASRLSGRGSFRVPQFHLHVLSQPVARLLYAGCLVGEPSSMCKR
jgi:hypothetical protein